MSNRKISFTDIVLPRLRRTRRGVTYLVTMGTTLLVAGLGLSALYCVRVQHLKVDSERDLNNARDNAIAGLDAALYQVKNNSSWRSNFSSGNWSADRTIGSGKYNFTGTDPFDSNITNSTSDPILITSTGKSGNAQKRMTVKLDARNLPIDSARVAMHAGSDIEFNACTATFDNWATSNDDIITKNSAVVNADIASADIHDSAGVSGIVTGSSTWPRAMPNNTSSSSDYSFATYNSSGTSISASDLPTGNSELLNNTSFSSNASGWTTYGTCYIARTTLINYSSPASLWVNGSTDTNSGPAQDVTASMIKGNNYVVSARLYSYGTSIQARLQLVITSSGSGTQTFSTSWTSCSHDQWKSVSGTLTPTWTGTLTSAQLRIATDDNNWIFIDDVSMMNTSMATNTLYIMNKVLADTFNPFGSGSTNTSGIYKIDCGNKALVISNCRIRGTLIVTNTTGITISNSVNWEPAVLGYPAIMNTGKTTFNMSSTALNEATLGVNLNPAVAPYNSASNTTATDTYPSLVTGIIYSVGDITFNGTNNILGCVIGQADIYVNATATAITYWEEILKNPPPGFRLTTPQIQAIPGSYRSVSN